MESRPEYRDGFFYDYKSHFYVIKRLFIKQKGCFRLLNIN